MAGRVVTYQAAVTGAMRPTGAYPVRLYITGSNHSRVIRCTGAQDNAVCGLVKGDSCATGVGAAIPCLIDRGERFLGKVATTVAAGARLKLGSARNFTAVGTTAGLDYVARVIEARTNVGLTWLEFVPGGKV